MTHDAAMSFFDTTPATPAPAASAAASPDAAPSHATPSPLRDPAFKIVEIGFLRLLPLARAARSKLVFLTVGFSGEIEDRLHGLFRRHDIAGFGLSNAALSEAEIRAIPARLPTFAAVAPSDLFVCLSLCACPASMAVLGLVGDDSFRPGLLHCADRDGFWTWAQIRPMLEAKGYASVGDLDGGEIFIDAALFYAEDPRPKIASFDVFDTLIARRCVDPWRVFEAVGLRAGIVDFLDQRRAAEQRVLQGNYRYDDIYDELARHYAWSSERRAEIQALELACEMETVIPIAENLVRVSDGDLLVSDMYLSESDIRGLVERAGLRAHVGLHVESHGKSSGRVWPDLNARFAIQMHLGDNRHADVGVPTRFGVPTQLTEISNLNLVEQTLMQTGLRNLALLCREARLATWHPDPRIRDLQVVQTSLNLPILILASVGLARAASAVGCASIHFCSRDGNLWLPLFEALQPRMGHAFATHYFLTSRLARKQGSQAYLDYARPHMQRDCMVVDLCGTGWSMANLAERLGLETSHLFLIDHCPPLDAFERAKPTPATCTIHKMFAQRPNANNVVLELANMAEHGMVSDMTIFGTTNVPRFAPQAHSEREMAAIREQRKCLLSAIDLMRHHDLTEVFDLDDASISFLTRSLYEYMSKQTDCFEMFAKSFLQENEGIVRTLVTR